MNKDWIPIDRIQHLLQYEFYVIAGSIFFLAFFIYKLFLKKISEKRHRNLKARFKNTAIYLVLSIALVSLYWSLNDSDSGNPSIYWLRHLALVTMFLSAVVFVKLGQICIYVYLFASNMSIGVPRLVSNLFTLVISVLIGTWIAANVFGFKIEAVLATSAIFSIVLGLALQDTLGNLFSGVALQIDKPYKIGDWIEIQSGVSKWTGQVQEITWRGTFLTSFMDEVILIPNKTIAQSQIFILTNANAPSRVGHAFRFSFDVDIEGVKKVMLEAVSVMSEISQNPPPRALLTEVSDSWFYIKIFYSISDYGVRYRVGDKVLTTIISKLREQGIRFAVPKYQIETDEVKV